MEPTTNTETMTSFRRFLHAYAAACGRDLSCRFIVDDDLPDVCPNCGESCELDGEPTCYECKCDPSRGKTDEVDPVCECCGDSGTIYVPRWNSWFGMVEVPVECDCRQIVGIPYNVMQEAISALSGLNAV